ncbi:hypothetical protein [Mycobacterium paraffinicum]|uniref:Uncharacterized protein n=1 Tax=Mycobacterium paraffinicum TaxID=53378 RepID=A0ABP8F6K8_9MYCO|nr:hypothetical protein [Mycobacterium paraffinicum]MCV7311278.1 hypothetical protein [Mycobacterium paraffinicum]
MAGRCDTLRFAYWAGAVADAVMVVPLLVPRVAAAMLGLHGFTPAPDYRYAAALCAALMAGWTALLLWAGRAPVDRRGVLLLTVCPVLVGLAAAGGYAISSGLVRVGFMAPILAIQLGLAVLFLSAHRRARFLAGEADRRG